MPSIASRIAGVIALVAGGYCFKFIAALMRFADQNGHTEGSPAGLGIFAICAAAALLLLVVGVALAGFGLFGLLFPWKRFTGRREDDEDAEDAGDAPQRPQARPHGRPSSRRPPR